MNTPHIEKELKMMIDKNIYNSLIHDFNLKPIIQINHYYFSNDPNYSLRIREINNEYIFTLKVKNKNARDEYEFKIINNDLNDPRIQELLNHFKIINPPYIGDLITYRSKIIYSNGELCIDENHYLGITDYELEYEFFDSNKDDDKEFIELLSKYHLIYKRSSNSKLGRFINEKSSHHCK